MPETKPEGSKVVRMIRSPPHPSAGDERRGEASATAPALPGEDSAGKKARRKKDKVRSAWISFVGRILAQLVGAAATVVLGLILARRIYPPDRNPETPAPAPAAPSAAVRTAARPREAGVSIAVLPFANISGDPQQEYFTDGMTEAIITDLAKVRALRVISRTSVMRYKGGSKPLPEIARELGVSAIVEGSVVRAGDRVRVTAQLIDATSDEHLWAESYDRDLKDVLALQAELAQAITREVGVALTPLEQEHLAARAQPVDPEAQSAARHLE